MDRPQAGREWFEPTLRDQLALGRPDQVALVFNRTVIATTPGRFWTRILNRGDQIGLQVHSKHSKVKQYRKEGRALRTKTTVNDTRDFGVGRLLTDANWQALLQIVWGAKNSVRPANHRFLEVRTEFWHPTRFRANTRRDPCL